ncbi:hypothetical protein GA0115260_101873 [Streptomyces sp. MnatMP-M27]|nr:hypothetical protein GA0115260_101873 [Streptomyces sp. MnatMP-M27]
MAVRALWILRHPQRGFSRASRSTNREDNTANHNRSAHWYRRGKQCPIGLRQR